MTAENPTWGAPRIHGELLKLGLEISESTVSRYLAQGGSSRDSGQRWLTFLKNHREALAAMDFFTVPTATFRVLYCFFVIAHARRKILHFNVTEHPTGSWIVQQLREAFPEDRAPQYLILDRDGKFNGEVATMLEYLGSELIRTAYRRPWQNGVAERWVGSCRRELLDHVIVLNEFHLRRLLRDYLEYYHDDRIHDALKQETPTLRVVERRPSGTAKVVGCPASAACIIAVNGKPPPEVQARPSLCSSAVSLEGSSNSETSGDEDLTSLVRESRVSLWHRSWRASRRILGTSSRFSFTRF